MTAQIEKEIKSCNTLVDYLNVLKRNYDLKGCSPSNMIKQLMLIQITKLVPKIHTPITLEAIKMKCLHSNNLLEFLQIIEKEITMQSDLSPEGKQKLVPATNDICKVTGLKVKDLTSGHNTGNKSGHQDPKKTGLAGVVHKIVKRKKH